MNAPAPRAKTTKTPSHETAPLATSHIIKTARATLIRDGLHDLLWAEIDKGPRFTSDLIKRAKGAGLRVSRDLVFMRLDPYTLPTPDAPRLLRLACEPRRTLYALPRDRQAAQDIVEAERARLSDRMSRIAQRLDPVALTALLLQGPQTVTDLALHFGVSRCTVPYAIRHTPLARLLGGRGLPSVAYIAGQEAKAHALRQDAKAVVTRAWHQALDAKRDAAWPPLWDFLRQKPRTRAELRTQGVSRAALDTLVQLGRIARTGRLFHLPLSPPMQPTTPSHTSSPTLPNTATMKASPPDPNRFPLLASMTQGERCTAKPSMRAVEPVAPKLTPTPRPTPAAKTGKVSHAQTAPRKILKPCLLPQGYGPAQREAVLYAVQTLDLMREAADAASVRVRLGQKRHQEAFPKRPDESECRAMLEALTQEGALVAHGQDSDRFYLLPDPISKAPREPAR